VSIRAVWFDVGEVLIDETREYGTWADWLGVPRHTFSAVFGAVIARGGDYREVFQYFQPGFDLDLEREKRFRSGLGEYLNSTDLYPDVRPCFEQLRRAGLQVGVAGNQTGRAGQFLRELHLEVDVLATSEDWGVAKPDDAFFSKILAVSGLSASEVAYVGDRLDNDISPAADVGLYTIQVRRGPWGYILDKGAFKKSPDAVVASLFEISAIVGAGTENV
jgi:HAD superfamily hydrolase (TIGR01549 family)